LELLENLIEKKNLVETMDIFSEEVFWNDKMGGHAKIMSGLFDPSEEELINIARMLAQEFNELANEAKTVMTMPCSAAAFTYDSTLATERMRSFKTSVVKWLLECAIRSTIVPLLADHILREANYYLCELGKFSMTQP